MAPAVAGRGGGRRSGSMVRDAEFRSYYGRR